MLLLFIALTFNFFSFSFIEAEKTSKTIEIDLPELTTESSFYDKFIDHFSCINKLTAIYTIGIINPEKVSEEFEKKVSKYWETVGLLSSLFPIVAHDGRFSDLQLTYRKHNPLYFDIMSSESLTSNAEGDYDKYRNSIVRVALSPAAEIFSRLGLTSFCWPSLLRPSFSQVTKAMLLQTNMLSSNSKNMLWYERPFFFMLLRTFRFVIDSQLGKISAFSKSKEDIRRKARKIIGYDGLPSKDELNDLAEGKYESLFINLSEVRQDIHNSSAAFLHGSNLLSTCVPFLENEVATKLIYEDSIIVNSFNEIDSLYENEKNKFEETANILLKVNSDIRYLPEHWILGFKLLVSRISRDVLFLYRKTCKEILASYRKQIQERKKEKMKKDN